MNPNPYYPFNRSNSIYASGDYSQINPFAPTVRPKNSEEKIAAKPYVQYTKSMRSQDNFVMRSLDNGGMQPNFFCCNNLMTGSNTFNNNFLPNMNIMQKSNDFGMINDSIEHLDKAKKRTSKKGMNNLAPLNSNSEVLNKEVANQIPRGEHLANNQPKFSTLLSKPRMRYTQMNSKSADFNDFNPSRSGQFNSWMMSGRNFPTNMNFGDRASEVSYGRRNSGDGDQLYSQVQPPSTSETKKIILNNTLAEIEPADRASGLGDFGNAQGSNFFSEKLESLEKYPFSFEDLQSFPIPPIPKEYKPYNKLYAPSKYDEFIEKLLKEADSLISNEQIERAKVLYLQVIKLDPYMGDIWRILGMIYYNEGKYLEAFNCFHGYVFHRDTEEEDPAFWLQMCDVYRKIELYDHSTTVLNSILSMKCDKQIILKTYYTLGAIYCEIYELEKAIEALKKALKVDNISKPAAFKIWLMMGQIEEEKSSYGNAIE